MAYRCQECGYRSVKWLGRCPGCGAWESFAEEREEKTPRVSRSSPARILRLSEVSGEGFKRYASGLSEFDRVLGGGLVPGALVLIGGDPGIGKSTLLLQVAGRYLSQGLSVIYLCGEESPGQVRLRAERLKIPGELELLPETDLSAALPAVRERHPAILMVDSIQTVYLPELSSAPGSVSQVREATAALLRLAKEEGVAIFLVGHVTKEGVIAGPRVLEHLVDVVLYFEGERSGPYRLLRAVKNRFGPVDEIGVFEMREAGLFPVENPSRFFLSGGGGAVFPALEGTRPLLVEIQALVVKSYLASPRRTAVGFDPWRLSMLLAILEKHLGVSFYDRDVFLNVAGGLRLRETGADLAVCAALLGSRLEKDLPEKTVFCGEVGLSGEVRPVLALETRLKEARRLGFSQAVLPWGQEIRDFPQVRPLRQVRELLDLL
ncbi:DNA repair protein RadA [Thermosulfurimonas marina]|uniref:DNA repair protein RadA n=1 Tax=Thermosulfurimonas marina TaxID=2047767 RepID=A0A6H1WQH8_9BACT|nr:DNA repair protein RadA [Thermosulfurimonas marina]QJA05475.1 DNA repair protein RadA [Thermosulfurimonas marina]